jgi:DivIVA domain-containing protein
MELTPKTLREVEFREKRHGYHHEDVDRFLEEVAAGLEVQQDRLRQAVERAQRAEALAAEAGGNDEAIRKTLVLAQRTADLAVQEAREQAARILAGAEQQAQSVIADAEDRARRTMEDSVADSRAELVRIEALRAKGQEDVDSLQRWLDEHKAHLQEALAEAAAAVERAGVMWPAPSTRPIDVPLPPGASRMAPPPPDLGLDADSSGPPTAQWSPDEEDHSDLAADHQSALSASSPSPAPAGPSASAAAATPAAPATAAAPAGAAPRAETQTAMVDLTDSPNDQALDDFFDDGDEASDDRRFGSRLRRRR